MDRHWLRLRSLEFIASPSHEHTANTSSRGSYVADLGTSIASRKRVLSEDEARKKTGQVSARSPESAHFADVPSQSSHS
jgi:hypothetical protein